MDSSWINLRATKVLAPSRDFLLDLGLTAGTWGLNCLPVDLCLATCYLHLRFPLLQNGNHSNTCLEGISRSK